MAARQGDRPEADGFVVKQDGRKPLFSKPNNPTNNNNNNTQNRLANSFFSSSRQPPSAAKPQPYHGRPQNTASPVSKIPHPDYAPDSVGSSGGFGRRKHISLSEAFAMAQKEGGPDHEEVMAGSPSPAPRSWRKTSDETDDPRLRRSLDEIRRSPAARLTDRNAQVARTLSQDRLVSGDRQSISDEIPGVPKLVPGIEDLPFKQTGSPEKSYAWDIEQDFTAGDLQVSNSPRLRIGPSQNTRIDEIRNRERQFEVNTSPRRTPVHSAAQQALSKRADEILARERRAGEDSTISPRPRFGTGNAKVDQVQQREKDGLTPKQYAAIRLAEIKEQNAATRTVSPSEHARRRDALSNSALRSSSAVDTAAQRGTQSPGSIGKPRSVWRREVSSAPPTQAASSSASSTSPPAPTTFREANALLRRLGKNARPEAGPSQTDTHHGVTPASPPPDSKRLTDTHPSSLRRATENARRISGGSNASSGYQRPSVGFAYDKAASSSGSSKSKRSSMNSEPDPTARIEGEAKLFAPQDNYSERGSVRAPSPMPEEDADDDHDRTADATPRPSKPDPLSMPTPQVIGAYVETPLTARPDRRSQVRERSRLREQENAVPDPETIFRDKETSVKKAAVEEPRPRPPQPTFTTEETVRPTRETRPPRELSMSTSRSRSRSASRPRPPVRNTAKLPTARQDLLDLQKSYDMDDTTIDDLEKMLAKTKGASDAEILALIQDLPATEDELDDIIRVEGVDIKRESSVEEAFTKMNRDMKAKLPDVKKEIEVVKESVRAEQEKQKLALERQALERQALEKQALEKQARQKQEKPVEKLPPPVEEKPVKTQTPKQPHHAPTNTHQHQHHSHASPQDECPLCISSPKQGSIIAYIHFPIPRFYHRDPTFRLTLLGLLVTLFSMWYAAETSTCAKFCRPATCTTQSPCVWAYDDPTFGYAIPVKVDQWLTGGRGRAVTTHLVEETRDWLADLYDVATGRSISDTDTANMSFEAKKRFRRRLAKKGLLRSTAKEPAGETRAKWDSWRRERTVREEAKDRGGHYYDDDEAIGEDEQVW